MSSVPSIPPNDKSGLIIAGVVVVVIIVVVVTLYFMKTFCPTFGYSCSSSSASMTTSTAPCPAGTYSTTGKDTDGSGGGCIACSTSTSPNATSTVGATSCSLTRSTSQSTSQMPCAGVSSSTPYSSVSSSCIAYEWQQYGCSTSVSNYLPITSGSSATFGTMLTDMASYGSASTSGALRTACRAT